MRAAAPDRHVHLILENEENEARAPARATSGEPRWYTAQWNDDVHHVLHVAATRREQPAITPTTSATPSKLGRALAEGFAFQGEMMPYRGAPRGEPSAEPAADRLRRLHPEPRPGRQSRVRRTADRLFAPAEAVRAVAAIYLLLPQIPMLFMGEEWGAAQPFRSSAISGRSGRGRARRAARGVRALPGIPGPEGARTHPRSDGGSDLRSAKLDWDDIARRPHAAWLDWYRRILAVRRARDRAAAGRHSGRRALSTCSARRVVVRWRSPMAAC